MEISLSELAVGSLVPASGAGGLALGAWVLNRGGMPAEQIARRSVAFFLIKSSVNFVAVAVLGALMAVGLLGPHRSLWLTAAPAVASTLAIAAVLALRASGEGAPRRRGRPAAAAVALRRRAARSSAAPRRRSRSCASSDPLLLAGAVGYWAWDNAVLWATFHAVGTTPPLTVVLMGYLIGQLGGLLPLPGGVGGIDGGLIGTLAVYGAPAGAATAAVLAYRLILFWLPLIAGSLAFASLRRGLNRPERPELCAAPAPGG